MCLCIPKKWKKKRIKELSENEKKIQNMQKSLSSASKDLETMKENYEKLSFELSRMDENLKLTIHEKNVLKRYKKTTEIEKSKFSLQKMKEFQSRQKELHSLHSVTLRSVKSLVKFLDTQPENLSVSPHILRLFSSFISKSLKSPKTPYSICANMAEFVGTYENLLSIMSSLMDVYNKHVERNFNAMEKITISLKSELEKVRKQKTKKITELSKKLQKSQKTIVKISKENANQLATIKNSEKLKDNELLSLQSKFTQKKSQVIKLRREIKDVRNKLKNLRKSQFGSRKMRESKISKKKSYNGYFPFLTSLRKRSHSFVDIFKRMPVKFEKNVTEITDKTEITESISESESNLSTKEKDMEFYDSQMIEIEKKILEAKAELFNVKKKHFIELKSYLKPPKIIEDIVRFTFLLFGYHKNQLQSWMSMRMLIDPSKLQKSAREFNLVEFVKKVDFGKSQSKFSKKRKGRKKKNGNERGRMVKRLKKWLEKKGSEEANYSSIAATKLHTFLINACEGIHVEFSRRELSKQ